MTANELAIVQESFDHMLKELQRSATIDLATLPTGRKEAEAKAWVDEFLNRMNLTAEQNQRLRAEMHGFGPLENLIADESITEIMINGRANIWFEREGKNHRHSDMFFSELSFKNFIHRLCEQAGVQVNLNQPSADGAWRDFRLHITMAPLALNGATICLRRHPKNPWTLEKLLEIGWANPQDVERLKKLSSEGANLLIVGGTGSGKTSLLNAILQTLPENERVVSIEDSDELQMPNDISLKLLTRFDANGCLKNFDQNDLLKQALRMKPDRLVIGEIRGGEAKDLLLALSTGHRGSLGTLHADSAQQALWRLEMLVQMGAPQWNLNSIRQLILLSLQAIVVVSRKNGERRLEGIHRITSLEGNGFLLERISD